jgi:exosortase
MTAMDSHSGQDFVRHALFSTLVVVFAAIFRHPLGTVMGSALVVDQYSHILLVVPVSAALFYLDRKKVLAQVAYSKAGIAALLILVATFAYASRPASALSPSGYLSLSLLFFVSWCLAAFVVCYGTPAFRRAAFPLLFLVLMVPLPDSVLERTVSLLQDGSADASCALFRAARIPYVRHGVVVALPKIEIEIAEECSGIRSSLVLFLCSLVLGQLFLQSAWKKALLTLAVLPLTLAKNGLRIFVLSVLGMYVDPSFLTGKLHRDGGILFFALAFASLGLLIRLLQKLRIDRNPTPPPPPAAAHLVKGVL